MNFYTHLLNKYVEKYPLSEGVSIKQLIIEYMKVNDYKWTQQQITSVASTMIRDKKQFDQFSIIIKGLETGQYALEMAMDDFVKGRAPLTLDVFKNMSESAITLLKKVQEVFELHYKSVNHNNMDEMLDLLHFVKGKFKPIINDKGEYLTRTLSIVTENDDGSILMFNSGLQEDVAALMQEGADILSGKAPKGEMEISPDKIEEDETTTFLD